MHSGSHGYTLDGQPPQQATEVSTQWHTSLARLRRHGRVTNVANTSAPIDQHDLREISTEAGTLRYYDASDERARSCCSCTAPAPA